MQSEKKWKKFERLTAAIHLVDMKDHVDVKWDEKIDGRQFDVILKFKANFYNYLTVIECKDYTRKVSVDKIESFITKSRDVGANKAIFVSSSGFQEGAIKVAGKHNIELFTLEEINSFFQEALSHDLSPALNIYNISFFAVLPVVKTIKAVV